MDFQIDDEEILSAISNEDVKVLLLRFKSNINVECETNIEIEIKAKDHCSADAWAGHLRENFIKTLVTMRNITAFRAEDKIEYMLKNKEEIQKMQLPVVMCNDLFATVSIPYPEISQSEFESNLKGILKDDEEIDECMFWLYITYAIPRIEKGLTQSDRIHQFRALWTAFNALYGRIYPKLGNRKAVEKFSQETYVVKYIRRMLSDAYFIDVLNNLAQANLKLNNGKVDISKELENSLKTKDCKKISKNVLLCLYAIRNAILHGDSDNEKYLCGHGFVILNSLIKYTLQQRFKTSKAETSQTMDKFQDKC